VNNAIKTVTGALDKVVGSPEHNENLIAMYFASNYQQRVDGQQLDYEAFIRHMSVLKQLTKRIKINIKSVVADEDTVFTHHFVDIEKSQGGKSEFEVFACFTLSSGKIIRCEELTRMINGGAGDQSLASRR